jgi:hypothetical protein
MSEEQVKKWLEKENIDKAIGDCVLKGEACNGDILHQYWHIFKTNSQFFNHILLDSLNKQDKAQDTNDTKKKIKHFSDALDKLFAK